MRLARGFSHLTISKPLGTHNTEATAMSGPSKRSRSKAQFPVRLHDMISYCETQGLHAVIGWVLGGRGFHIYDPDSLSGVLPMFFGKTKYKSFIRQLNMWDFDRISNGPNKGTYMHPYFVKGNRELCGQMNRQIMRRLPRAAPNNRPLPEGKHKQGRKEKANFRSTTQHTEPFEYESGKGCHGSFDPQFPTSVQEEFAQGENIAFSCDGTRSMDNKDITRRPMHRSNMQLQQPSEPTKTNMGEDYSRDNMDYFSKPSPSACSSWLLQAPLQCEAFQSEDSKNDQFRRGSNSIASISDILKEYSNLFELDEDAENDIHVKSLSSLVLSATNLMNSNEFSVSSPLLSCSSTDSSTENYANEEDGTVFDDDQGHFAGRNFFLVENNSNQPKF